MTDVECVIKGDQPMMSQICNVVNCYFMESEKFRRSEELIKCAWCRDVSVVVVVTSEREVLNNTWREDGLEVVE